MLPGTCNAAYSGIRIEKRVTPYALNRSTIGVSFYRLKISRCVMINFFTFSLLLQLVFFFFKGNISGNQ